MQDAGCKVQGAGCRVAPRKQVRAPATIKRTPTSAQSGQNVPAHDHVSAMSSFIAMKSEASSCTCVAKEGLVGRR